MNLQKIRIIMEKEFDEIMKNKIILSTIIGMPILFSIVIPIAMLAPIVFFSSPGDFNHTANGTTNSTISEVGIKGVNSAEEYLVYMVSATLAFFMMLPAMLPTIISSYSIIGEKKNRTLEPLLAAPITVEEIMAGKALSAMLPALLATWVAAAIYAVIAYLLTFNVVHRILVPDLSWIIGLVILAPLLSFLGVMITLVISSRVNDPRTAQQVSVIFVLPLMALFIGQMSGLMMIDTRIILGVCIVALIADIAALKIGSDLFDREEILTRWK